MSDQLEDDILLQLLADFSNAVLALLFPAVVSYLSLYAFAKRWMWTFRILSAIALVQLWQSERAILAQCAALNALVKFGVAVATMKTLDIHALSLTSMPTYTAGTPPRPSIMALILLTELRYESFTPNPIRLPPDYPSAHHIHMNEKAQLLLHTLIFTALQCVPQTAPIKALGVLFAIWIIWTAYQLILRYRSSPPLFGPIYLADSLAGFWTDTWHNAFASPCYSLAYSPTLFVLAALGFPRVVARAAAVVSGFALMALFHMYALSPILDDEGLGRVGVFFVGNGVLTVVEALVWGKKKHWVRAGAAWVLELGMASWAVESFGLPDGLVRAELEGMCRPKR